MSSITSSMEEPGHNPVPQPALEPIVEAVGISKRYGPTIALADAGIRIMSGKSHALVGRNGAGKSTLVSILTGIQGPDSGTVRFGEERAPALSDRGAWRQRVACVYQHSTIIPDLSVAENLFINRQPRSNGFIDWPLLRRQASELLERWRVDVSPDTRAGDLKVEQRQLVEIARALSYGARFVILDEPTAQLDGNETRRLFKRMDELKADGVTFMFISHHLQEVYEVCEAVTVFRDARHIVTAPVAELPKDALIRAMTGDETLPSTGDARRTAATAGAAPALVVRGLCGADYADVSFELGGGEVVGLAGATSSGRAGVAEAIAGLSRSSAGSVEVGGRPLPNGDVPSALALGVGCVPRSRHHQGLVLTQSVGENATMTALPKLGWLGFVSPRRKDRLARHLIANLGVVTQGPAQQVSSLSGGNQQKVVMGRALATDPSVLVLIDPTAGVDVKSKVALLAEVEVLREGGKSILISSSEPDDLRTCDRVIVLLHGRIVAEHPAGWTDAELISSIEGIN